VRSGSGVTIGQALVAKGAITPQQLERALGEQRSRGGLLGDTLLGLNFVSEEVLSQTLAELAGIGYQRLDQVSADPRAISLVPRAFARRHMVAPLALNGPVLQVALSNPFDVLAIDELRQMTGRQIEALCATRADVQRALERFYTGREDLTGLVNAGMTRLGAPGTESLPADAPVVKLLDYLLLDAINRGATDLHIEPEDRSVRLRYRVDGVLMQGDTLPRDLLPGLVSRLKVMAGLDIAEQRLPQEGRVTQMADGRPVDLRISTFPTVFGEKVAVRVLEKEKLVRGLEELGLSKKNLDLLHDVLTKSRGLILVTGPTGAGKTTTLYSALAYLGSREKNIVTVEDPVEYEIPEFRQTQVRPKAGLTFGTAIRSVLRQDPDIIMVGEIRDPETAELTLRAALSGVLVFSTLHTQDSAGAVPRLMDMGLESYLLASSVVAVIAQRLLRLICPRCKEKATYAPETLAKVGLGATDDVRFFQGKGCDHCNGTGYRGRTGVFEILTVEPAIHDLIRQRSDSRLIKETAVRTGMKTLLDDALSKAIMGTTSLDEVLRIAYE
jgi:type IV pilus assembly protein PilB